MISRYQYLLKRDSRPVYGLIKRFSENDSSNPKQSSINLSPAVSSDLAQYDLVINGGGIVGLAFLLYLQTSPVLKKLRVLLLEHQPEKQLCQLEDLHNQERKLSNRVSSLTCASKNFLEKLGIWDSVRPFTKPISSMHIWSTQYVKGVTFFPEKNSCMDNILKLGSQNRNAQEDVVCYVLENEILLSSLMNKIDLSAIKFNCRLDSIQSRDSRIQLFSSDGQEIETRLLIGSDGFNSFVRKVSDLRYFNLSLNQNAIVGTVQISKQSDADPNDIAYQRFVPHLNSVLAILPLTDYHASFVLSVPKERTHSLMEISDDAFVDTLNEALFNETTGHKGSSISSIINSFDSLLDRFIPKDRIRTFLPTGNPPQVLSIVEGSRAAFPLHFGTTLPKLVGKVQGNEGRVVLIGDAAHRVHPLAGQGLNLGLGDAEILGRCLEQAFFNGEDIFSDDTSGKEGLDQALFSMERSRLVKLLPMMVAIHSMQPLFSYLPANSYRIFNQFNMLKNEVVRFANSV